MHYPSLYMTIVLVWWNTFCCEEIPVWILNIFTANISSTLRSNKHCSFKWLEFDSLLLWNGWFLRNDNHQQCAIEQLCWNNALGAVFRLEVYKNLVCSYTVYFLYLQLRFEPNNCGLKNVKIMHIKWIGDQKYSRLLHECKPWAFYKSVILGLTGFSHLFPCSLSLPWSF